MSTMQYKNKREQFFNKKGDVMYSKAVISVFLMVLLFTACKKDDVTGSDEFTNKITLGTSMTASTFTINGQSTTFTRLGGTATIYFRLESAVDVGGSGVSIKVEKQSGSSYTVVGTYAYANPQGYGHIVMSSFTISEAGSYRITGLLTGSLATVATVAITVQ